MNIEQIEDEQNRAAKEILNAAVVDAIKRLTQIRPGDVMIIANPKPIRFEIGMISEAEQKREQEWIRQSWTTLHYSMGDCLEGLTLPQAVALLVSQRENARNAHAATKRRCDELELALEDAREFIIGNGGDPCDEAYLEMSKRLGWVIQGEEVK